MIFITIDLIVMVKLELLLIVISLNFITMYVLIILMREVRCLMG